jgi:hypothetical protein
VLVYFSLDGLGGPPLLDLKAALRKRQLDETVAIYSQQSISSLSQHVRLGGKMLPGFFFFFGCG